MYNQYIPKTPEPHRTQGQARDSHRPPQGTGPLDGLGGLLKNFDLGGLLKGLGLGNLDTGDILLLLILLFLFLEGDNLELVITLGLLILFGLGDDEEDDDEITDNRS